MSFKLLTLIVVLLLFTSTKPSIKVVGDQDWWKHSVFYQIYPRSFKDSNNDGVGDLQGIISKLDYLKDAGVTVAWLSPIFSSPQVDQGYDISDYRDVHSEYGTLGDFDELVIKAHALGIKIFMDFVPNHTSNEHEWFVKSENREAGYEDYYVWADGNSTGGPPNNWLSIFKYSAWEYSEKRKQYYLHQFAVQQPDLNYRNPAVVREMKDIMTFWMDRGVDGFRVDAVPYLFEDAELRDEPLSNNSNVSPDNHGYLSHIYTSDLPETFDMIYQWREHIDNYSQAHGGDARIFVTEAYTDIKNTMKFYGDGKRLGAYFTFNFQLITDLDINSTARDIVMAIRKWLIYMPFQFVANWVIGSHDNARVATRLGVGNIDGYNMLVALLPGVAVTYNGEEIGMENGDVSWEQGKDPNALNGLPEDFSIASRDFERTPFHWDATANAGFNEGAKAWLPVSTKYLGNNLAQQTADGVWSHYRIYQKLVAMRKESAALKGGKMEIEPFSNDVLTLVRSLGSERVVLLFNIGNGEEVVDLTRQYELAGELKVVVPSVNSSRKIGDILHVSSISLSPHESIVAVQGQ